MVEEKLTRKIYAIEPNDDMRESGIADSKNNNIKWKKESAEETGLDTNFLTGYQWHQVFTGRISQSNTEFTRIKKGGYLQYGIKTYRKQPIIS